MTSQSNQILLASREWSAIQEAAPEAEPRAKLEVNVVFTNRQGTLAALEAAGNLARSLGARINLLAPQIVPYAFPLTRPPVSIQFTEQRLLDLAYQGAQGPLETNVQVYLCRDTRQALLQVLKPKSLVIIGGRARWWAAKEGRLARILSSEGHQVVLAHVK